MVEVLGEVVSKSPSGGGVAEGPRWEVLSRSSDPIAPPLSNFPLPST
jgi:hypothetical protein